MFETPFRKAGFLTSFARVLLWKPWRRSVLAAARRMARRWPRLRPVRTSVFYLGEALAEIGEPIVGRLQTGSPIVLDPRDYGHSHIFFFGVYEPPTTAFFSRVARRGWVVVDVGANAGYYSLLARDLGGPGSSIHAFEPNPEMASLLERSIELASGDGEITLVRAACGRDNGTAELEMSSDRRNFGLARISDAASADSGPRRTHVPVVRLDDYCRERGVIPELVKIDVEGFEHEVCAGMKRLLSTRLIPCVVCELSSAPGRPSPAALVEQFAAWRYDAYDIAGEGLLEPLRSVVIPTERNICFVASNVHPAWGGASATFRIAVGGGSGEPVTSEIAGRRSV